MNIIICVITYVEIFLSFQKLSYFFFQHLYNVISFIIIILREHYILLHFILLLNENLLNHFASKRRCCITKFMIYNIYFAKQTILIIYDKMI